MQPSLGFEVSRITNLRDEASNLLELGDVLGVQRLSARRPLRFELAGEDGCGSLEFERAGHGADGAERGLAGRQSRPRVKPGAFLGLLL